MSKVVVVTSGKGGVGKTTSTAALGAALARGGKRVCVVDFDVGLRNLDLVVGAERRVVYDLINVAQGDAKLGAGADSRQARGHAASAGGLADPRQGRPDGRGRGAGDRGNARPVRRLCDSPAGIERGALLAMRFADEAVVVTNPEVSSVRDSDRIIGLLDSQDPARRTGPAHAQAIASTRFARRAPAAAKCWASPTCSTSSPCPCSASSRKAKKFYAPPTSTPHHHQRLDQRGGRAYGDAARRIMGETVPMLIPGEKKSFFTRFLGRRAA